MSVIATYNRVVIETGSKRVFASAIDWPGWCRSAKTEGEALDTLVEYAARYQRVAEIAVESGLKQASARLEVVERLPGSATTDFGAPDAEARVEQEPMTRDECERQIRLLRACWQVFDETAERVSEDLQKGPRGGGRNRSKLIDHTFEAERSYARKIGVKTPKGAMSTEEGLRAHRDAVCDAIRDINARGEASASWSLRYFIRRAAWHVMDHAWEMADKDLTGRDA